MSSVSLRRVTVGANLLLLSTEGTRDDCGWGAIPHSHSGHWGGLPFLSGHLFQIRVEHFLLKTVGDHSQMWGRLLSSELSLCVLNCWLTVAEMSLSPGFWIWSWMKLACGKAKHSVLRYVFLTWNQLALHKYRGFISQQKREASRAVRQVKWGQGLSLSCVIQRIFSFKLAVGKDDFFFFLFRSFLPFVYC